jgi:hypothetical protein
MTFHLKKTADLEAKVPKMDFDMFKFYWRKTKCIWKEEWDSKAIRKLVHLPGKSS